MQVQPPLPFVGGSELAGVVLEIASDVERVHVGDRVLGMAWTGKMPVRGGWVSDAWRVAVMLALPS